MTARFVGLATAAHVRVSPARDAVADGAQFGDVGQVYDPWTALAWLAEHTSRITLAAGSVIFPLRHPIDLAEQAASVDHLSGGRLILGVASGDRPVEFPAYGLDHATRGARYREAVGSFRELLSRPVGPDTAEPGTAPAILSRSTRRRCADKLTGPRPTRPARSRRPRHRPCPPRCEVLLLPTRL
ncbi:LLM class flavin-dependent oxidoreductase [Streptomyces sp. NPDC002164]|uniref:LLM class flavin-dependent oxidoreductase n=1 Tax=Streptomyces sp. NPDC002164 TaxID=3364633 RepID=UPI00369C4C39